MRKKIKKCVLCGEKKAKLIFVDENEKLFCSLHCAARYGVSEALNTNSFCDTHGEWHHPDEECQYCHRERFNKDVKNWI